MSPRRPRARSGFRGFGGILRGLNFGNLRDQLEHGDRRDRFGHTIHLGNRVNAVGILALIAITHDPNERPEGFSFLHSCYPCDLITWAFLATFLEARVFA